MDILPFSSKLITKDYIREKAVDSSPLMAMSDDHLTSLLSWAEYCGMGYMAVRDNVVVAAAGAWPLWNGVYQGWALMLQPGKSAFRIIRTMMRLIPEFIQSHKVVRLQIDINDGVPSAKKLAEALKFKPECNRKKYGPDGNDYWLYRIII